MSTIDKTALKISECADIDPSLLDVHRPIPRAHGGIYTPSNAVVITPREHMERHGNLRVRCDLMDDIKAAFDDRNQVMKLKNKVANQLLAYARNTDHAPNEKTVGFLNDQLAMYKSEVASRDRMLSRMLNDYAQEDRLAGAALGVRGIGPITIIACLVYIDLDGVFPAGHPRAGQEKCPHASSLWKYAGLDKPSHERYEKGETSGGNKTLRTFLYLMAESQIKSCGPYREIYDNTKARLEQFEVVTQTRNTQGRLIDAQWKDTKPCHRAGAATRKMMKAFLADWWYVGRDILGLDTNPLYAEAVLKGGHRTVQPEARGWRW